MALKRAMKEELKKKNYLDPSPVKNRLSLKNLLNFGDGVE